MRPPTPTFTFTIPSLYDDITLDCRLYLPQSRHSTRHSSNIRRKAAVIAHPYAPLGGCYDNPVVITLAEKFLSLGWVVATFNFRGAGQSGRTTWSGKGEIDDYVSVVGFLMVYLTMLERGDTDQTSPHDLIVLGGYSYGSLIVSHLPPTPQIVDTFNTIEMGTAAHEIFLRAEALAEQSIQAMSPSDITPDPQPDELPEAPSPSKHGQNLCAMGGEETPGSLRKRSGEHNRTTLDALSAKVFTRHGKKLSEMDGEGAGKEKGPTSRDGENPSQQALPRIAVPHTAYLLVSPLLPPLSTALATSLLGRLKSRERENLTSASALAVFGDSDAFTSASRLSSWGDKLVEESHENFEHEVINGAGHFWREGDVLYRLTRSVEGWSIKLEDQFG